MRPWIRNSIRALGILVAGSLAYLIGAPRVELYRLEHRDPVKEAEAALRSGDRRLYAVEMFRIHVPAADVILGREAAYQCSLRFVSRRTSDLQDGFTQRLNGVALSFAARYNTRILADHQGCTPAPLPPNPRLQRPGA
jgi:hypothetical protein